MSAKRKLENILIKISAFQTSLEPEKKTPAAKPGCSFHSGSITNEGLFNDMVHQTPSPQEGAVPKVISGWLSLVETTTYSGIGHFDIAQ